MSQFKKVKISDIRRETPESVSIAFEVPEELVSEFEYLSGQYVTIRKQIKGEDIRRSYSLCSAPFEDDFRVAVKRIEGGKMSSFLNNEIKVGDEIELMPPVGNFGVDKVSNAVGFAAGSGITPIISMIKTVLEKGGKFTLFYGNKDADNTIFKSQLDELSLKYSGFLNLNYIYSRDDSVEEFFKGRLTSEKCKLIISRNIELLKAEGFYLCGPEEMINNISNTLKEFGVSADKIHFELFTTPIEKKDKASEESLQGIFSGESRVTVIMDGEEFDFTLNHDGDFILDAAMEVGADVPFSCKGAVCCTCKAQVIEGEAIMEMNYSLSDAEVKEGFILTCQAHPNSEKIVVDYDVI